MARKNEMSGPAQIFEDLMQIDEDGVSFWTARDLMLVFEYKEWRLFEEVIGKAREAAKNSGQIVKDHFGVSSKMVKIGSGARRELPDWKLSRYASYLIAQNGNPQITAVAVAQTYFAYQTRKQEVFDSLPEVEKRLHIRGEVRSQNVKLASSAHQAGVSNFGRFNNAGYLGLYGISLPAIKAKKGIGTDDLLDRAGSTELAANLFRITQTDEKLQRNTIEGKRGENRAVQTHHEVGRKVRQTIQDIGGVLPENLPASKHLKEVRKELKALGTFSDTMERISRVPVPKQLPKGRKPLKQ